MQVTQQGRGAGFEPRLQRAAGAGAVETVPAVWVQANHECKIRVGHKQSQVTDLRMYSLRQLYKRHMPNPDLIL